MPTALKVIAGLVAGYVAGALIGVGLIELVSGNTHDKSMEVAMTAAFVTGPIGAAAGAIAGFVWGRRGSS